MNLPKNFRSFLYFFFFTFRQIFARILPEFLASIFFGGHSAPPPRLFRLCLHFLPLLLAFNE